MFHAPTDHPKILIKTNKVSTTAKPEIMCLIQKVCYVRKHTIFSRHTFHSGTTRTPKVILQLLINLPMRMQLIDVLIWGLLKMKIETILEMIPNSPIMV